MPFDLRDEIARNQGRGHDLHREHVNPQWARVLKTIGFDRTYTRARGAHLWDDAGNQYLDFLGGYAVANVGRNHPTVRKALADLLALDLPGMVQFETPLLSGMLAAELKRRVGRSLDYVFFTNSGAEGVEAAIKFARCATGRPAVVFCKKAFHGLTAAALACNGDDCFRAGFGPFFPDTRQIPFNDLAELERVIAARDVAAFIVEPIQGKGVNIPSPGFLRAAAALCRRYGTLFIADEVQTGVGRTGKFLALDHEPGVEPDILILSKALSAAYVPVGAVLTRAAVWSRVFSSMDRAIVHSSTFHQNPMAMVAGLASLRALDDDNLVENANRAGAALMDGLRAMLPRFELMKEVRGRGLMIAVEFGPPRSIALKAAWSMIHRMDGNLFAQAIVMPLLHDHRVLTQVAGHNLDVVKLTPPLCISQEDVAWFLSAFEQVMDRLHRFPGPAWDVLARLGKLAVTGRQRELAEV